ncbi:MAG: phosphoribosylanthranilate isomerase [Phycisphaerales bacterium]
MARTRIKICGITREEDAFAACEAGADALGFVFAKQSKRFVDPNRAWDIACAIPPFVSRVGLTVDLSPDAYDTIRESFPFDLGQLHGSEDVLTAQACGPDVIKAIRFDASSIAQEIERWNAVHEIDALLIDGSSGGEGTAFDWAALKPHMAACHHPVIIAGGLTHENVGEAIRTLRPFAVDVSSGVESAPGVKDAGLMEKFCAAVRAADC